MKKMFMALTLAVLSSAVFAVSSVSAGAQLKKPPAIKRSPVNPAFLAWQTNATYRASCSRYGYRPSPALPTRIGSKLRLSGNLRAAQVEELPTRFNLCDSNLVTSVKDQGDYNTCWTFAAMASLESWILRDQGRTVDLSENHLAVNNGFDWGFDGGGNGDMATAYFLRWGGPLLEVVDPYPNPLSQVVAASSYHVQRFIGIPLRESANDNEAIKRALVQFGVVDSSYYHDNSFYNEQTHAYCYLGDEYANHAIAIVGWDDDYPATNFLASCRPTEDGAFIVKNSWGEGRGDDGYCYISYSDFSLGYYEEGRVFASAESIANYGSIYQYDPLGVVEFTGYENTDTAWSANMFTSSNDCTICAVGFYTFAPYTSYEVYVYAGESEGCPMSGECRAQESGTREYAGYDTVILSTPVNLATHQRFSVVVKTVAPDGISIIPFESAYPDYSSQATSANGESFINSDPERYLWEDISLTYGNCCIKAYTQRAGSTPLAIPFQTLAGGIIGCTYSAVLTASGGMPPYTWAPVGSLPSGLTMDANGIISGTPTTVGDFAFDVSVTDAEGATETTSDGFFSLTVAEDTALAGDDFTGPVVIYGTNGTYHVDRFDEYTLEDGEPYHTKYPTGTGYGWRSQYASAWFKWTAPGDGTVTFKTRSSGGGYVYPTYIAVYTGDALISASRQAYSCDNTSSGDYSTSCSLAVSGGTVYRVAAVLGWETSNANLDFTWSGTFANPATQSTEVPVPYSWLEGYYPGVTDFEGRANSMAANGRNTVEEAYVAGLNPTNSSSVFTASIGVTNDTVYISWSPDLNAGGTHARDYRIWGADSLTGTWTYPTNALHRFFKVTVGMPQ